MSEKTLNSFSLILIIFFFSCAQSVVIRKENQPPSKSPSLGVKILQTQTKIFIQPDKAGLIKCYKNKKVKKVLNTKGKITVDVWPSGLVLLKREEEIWEKKLDKISFESQEKNRFFKLNHKRYRGNLVIYFTEKTKELTVVNELPVEDYLKGVVPLEIGTKLIQIEEEAEALKAQAVAARTYTLSHLRQYGNIGYDLEATVTDQVYGGMDFEHPLTDKAVQDTKGEVILYQTQYIKAYYHANCGGSTDNISEVWDKPQENYLTSINDSIFCNWASNYRWTEVWTKQELEDKLTLYISPFVLLPLGGLGEIKDLEIQERTSGNRVKTLKFTTTTGEFYLNSDQMRWVLRRSNSSNSILPSTQFDIYLEKDTAQALQKVILQGKGNGHGVGLCQIGAIGRARYGYNYLDILLSYYPGTQVLKKY